MPTIRILDSFQKQVANQSSLSPDIVQSFEGLLNKAGNLLQSFGVLKESDPNTYSVLDREKISTYIKGIHPAWLMQ